MRKSALFAMGALACALGPGCNEPETVPAPSAAMIGPEGGALQEGQLRITIPPGALSESIEFSIVPTADAPIALGPRYRVQPQTELGQDAILEYTFTASEVNGRDPNQLVIGRDVGAEWDVLPRTDINFDTRIVTCLDSRISLHYGLVVSQNIPGTTDTDADTDTPSTSSTNPTLTDPSSSTADPPTTGVDSSSGPSSSATTATGSSSSSSGSSSSDSSSSDSTDSEGGGECSDGSVDEGQVCFIEGLAFDAPAGPRAAIARDLDGDGSMDLLVAGAVDNTVQTRFGLGNGILVGGETYVTGTEPFALALTDVDGGAPDLVIVHASDATLGVLSGAADGTFGELTSFPTGASSPRAVSLADINEDGQLDAALASATAGVTVMLGAAGGMFGEGSIVDVGGPAIDVFVSDFSGDDNVDIVGIVGPNLVLAAGNGAGLFGAATTTPVGATATSMAIADFNGDGNDDAAISTEGLVTVALGNGVGGFGGGVPFTVGAGTVAMAVGDVSADGNLDIVTVDQTDQTVTVLTGNGSGSFDETFTFSVGQLPTAIALADFNSDGVDDIAVTNFDDDDTTVLLSDH